MVLQRDTAASDLEELSVLAVGIDVPSHIYRDRLTIAERGQYRNPREAQPSPLDELLRLEEETAEDYPWAAQI